MYIPPHTQRFRAYVLQWAAILSNWWAMQRLNTVGEVPAIFDESKGQTFFYHCVKIVLREARGR